MPADDTDRPSREGLEAAFDHEFITDKRAAAETAYALAFRYRNEDLNGQRRFDLAKSWALRAIDILDALPSDTLDQIASSRAAVGDVPVPDLLHAGVVRERLGDVLTEVTPGDNTAEPSS